MMGSGSKVLIASNNTWKGRTSESVCPFTIPDPEIHSSSPQPASSHLRAIFHGQIGLFPAPGPLKAVQDGILPQQGLAVGLRPQHLVSSITQPTQSGLLHLVSLPLWAAEAAQGCINPH